MFKKSSFKILAIIFVALLGVFLITKLLENRERSFRSDIVDIEDYNITKFEYIPDPLTGEKIEAYAEGDGWKVRYKGKVYNADGGVIENLITGLTVLKPERVAATSKTKWKEYQVDDSTGLRVTLYDDDKVVADLYIGKFSYLPQQGQNPYQQQQGKMTSYVRLADEKEVYAVDGFLKMSYQDDVNNIRLRFLANTRKEDITRVVFEYPGDGSFTLSCQGDQYLIDGIMADSAATVKYLTALARLGSVDFIDDVSIDYNNPDFKIRIESQNIPPIEINAFAADTVNKFIITSSINQGTFFSGAGNGKLFEKAFVSRNSFFPVPTLEE